MINLIFSLLTLYRRCQAKDICCCIFSGALVGPAVGLSLVAFLTVGNFVTSSSTHVLNSSANKCSHTMHSSAKNDSHFTLLSTDSHVSYSSVKLTSSMIQHVSTSTMMSKRTIISAIRGLEAERNKVLGVDGLNHTASDYDRNQNGIHNGSQRSNLNNNSKNRYNNTSKRSGINNNTNNNTTNNNNDNDNDNDNNNNLSAILRSFFQISYLWYSLLGASVTLIVSIIVSFVETRLLTNRSVLQHQNPETLEMITNPAIAPHHC